MTSNGPQKENGFTPIANEIMEQLARADLGKHEFRCVMYLIRITYGYHRKVWTISMDEWVNATGLDRGNVGRALRNLIRWQVILKTDKGNGRGHKSTYGFNKHYNEWRIGANSVTQDTVSDTTNSVATDTVSSDKQCQNSPINSVKIAPSTTSPKERKKVVGAAAAESLPQVEPFADAYEQTWGRLVESPYIGERIKDWQTRITLDAWRYALQESANANARNWKYLTRILERVERDGYSAPAPTQPTPVLDITLEDIYGHR